jgi:uncharacterized membrane protein YphA (DoxX/SURF4 family)
MRLPGTILQGILARAALAFLRIYLGGVFVLSAWAKLQTAGSAASASDALIAWGELFVGTTLVLGLLTRLSAVLAFVLTIGVGLARNPSWWSLFSAETAWACIAIALMLGAAGRTFGLDGLLARRWMRSPFW